MSRTLSVPILGAPEYFLALDAGYLGDHAAWGETSLMLYLDPPSVDLSQLGDAPHKGVFGRDPKKYASREDGQKIAEIIIERLTSLARQMPGWDANTLHRFIAAESALVDRQIELAGEKKIIWSAWRNVGKGDFQTTQNIRLNNVLKISLPWLTDCNHHSRHSKS